GACAPARQRRDRGDAWGKMRDPSSWAYDSPCALPPASATTRHFTGHESLANACLINANARLYDPQIGRFLSADPTVDALYNPQDLNRYSYVLDNPLSLTDPTGYGGLFKNPLVGAVAGLAAAALFQYELLPFIEGTTFAALLAATTPAAIAASPAAASGAAALLAVNAGVAGGISGAITTGSLKGAVLGGLEAEAFYQVGSALQSATGSMSYGAQTATTMVAHGMVGGLFSIGQKGGFGSGFLAAGIGAAADTPELETGPVGDIVIQATAGGVGSILGGGKFANGAVTGAFGYLFNRAAHEMQIAEADEDEEREDLQDPFAQAHTAAWNNAYNQLKAVAPNDPNVVFAAPSGWVPSETDVEALQARVSIYTSSLERIHSEDTLTTGSARASYQYWLGHTNQEIINSLRPGEEEPLTVAPGGRVEQGNTRIFILQTRSFDVNTLPRTPNTPY
ncbi:MAG TPA: RHS repeat-associated core domain-containing protein, partial [Rhizomicrobium sp.]